MITLRLSQKTLHYIYFCSQHLNAIPKTTKKSHLKMLQQESHPSCGRRKHLRRTQRHQNNNEFRWKFHIYLFI